MLNRVLAPLNNRYGSKRGCLNHWQHRVLGLTGQYRDLQQVEWERVERLVFLCMGNICRSPLAEAAARAAGYPAISIGISCTLGAAADPRARGFARSRGLDLEAHGATPIDRAELTATDLLVGMEPRHLAVPAVQAMSQVQKTLAGLWLQPRLPYIHDPYSASEAYFHRCETLVLQATENLLKNAPSRMRGEWKTSTP